MNRFVLAIKKTNYIIHSPAMVKYKFMKHNHNAHTMHQPDTKATPRSLKEVNAELTALKEHFAALEKHVEEINEHFRNYVGKLSVDDMGKLIENLNLSDKSLHFLCEGITLGDGNDEIYIASAEQIRNRLTKPGQEPEDHLNYTAL